MIPALLLGTAVTAGSTCRVTSHHRNDTAELARRCGEVSDDDPLVRRARAVLAELARVAGLVAVQPPLLVLRDYGGLHAWTTTSGAIVVPRKVLEACAPPRSRTADGDACLAFVLAHEIAHQIHGDALPSFLQDDLDLRRAQAETTRKAEILADSEAVTLMQLTRHDVQALLKRTKLLDALLQERAETAERPGRMRDRLRDQDALLPLFHAGMACMMAGKFEDGSVLIEDFVQQAQFRGPAELNNIGYARLQSALQRLDSDCPRRARRFVFHYSLDPSTRAGTTRGGGLDCAPPGELAKATAILADVVYRFPKYLPAYLNLAAAQILAGDGVQAWATVKDARTRATGAADERLALANLEHVARYIDVDPQGALRDQRALAQSPDADAIAFFNLARMEEEAGNPDAARVAWRRVRELAPRGAHADEAARALGLPAPASLPAPALPAPPEALGTRPRRPQNARSPNGGGRLSLIHWSDAKRTWTAYAIEIRRGKRSTRLVQAVVAEPADDERDPARLLERYGVPPERIALGQGVSVLRYRGLAFEVRAGRVERRIFFAPGD